MSPLDFGFADERILLPSKEYTVAVLIRNGVIYDFFLGHSLNIYCWVTTVRRYESDSAKNPSLYVSAHHRDAERNTEHEAQWRLFLGIFP